MIDLDEIERLARAATPGPWEYRSAKRPVDGQTDYGIGAQIDGRRYCIAEVFGRVSEFITPNAFATAAFIAALNPAAVLELVERVREAERALECATRGGP